MNEDTKFTDQFLSDIERDAIQSVADKPMLMNALKKVILADVYFKGTLRNDMTPDPTRNAALAFAFSDKIKSNEEIGQDVRALAEGVRLVEGGFTRIEKYKSVTPKKEDKKVTGR